ncbi:MAG: inositol monophosphatase [Firmicutes bacterium]|jgi:myo-inositol-1(or 4)-monophosphatase|nr:inositol monophosphatase [Bacillota bacterium]
MSLLERTKEIVLQAGEILISKMESGFTITKKGSIDLVTDADQAVEAFLIERLTREFPGSAFYAEEQGWVEGEQGAGVWIIDPIDGTTNFAHGFPYFSISVALARGGETVLGIVYNPVWREWFTAEKGKGAYRCGRPIRVSATSDLQNSLLVTGFPYDIKTTTADNMPEFARATRLTQGVRRTGSAALDLCNVACGRFDGYWEQNINLWDVAAGALILEEAGGRITDFYGKPLTTKVEHVLATNGLIHDELFNVLHE